MAKFHSGKNRDRLGIIAAILDSADSGSNKTKIMFEANLSFRLLNKYLDIAVNAGFVQVDGSVYLLTENGRGFLRRYGEFRRRYNRMQKMLQTLASEHEQMSNIVEKNKLLCH